MVSHDSLVLSEDLCQISFAQEDYLSRCRFAGKPDDESSSNDDSGHIAMASTGITIISPPDSLEEVAIPLENDVCHTQPEESVIASSQEQEQMITAENRDDLMAVGAASNAKFAGCGGHCTDDLRAVDSGRDTDLGFSAEPELTARIEIDPRSQSSLAVDQENQVINCAPTNFRVKVRERELDAGDGLCKSPSKKLKIVNENLGLATPEPCLGSEAAKTLERVAKSIEKLKSSAKTSKTLNENVVLETSRVASGTKTGNSRKTVKNLSPEGIIPLESLKSLQNHQIEEVNGGDWEFQGTSSAKRKLQFQSEDVEYDLKDNNEVSASVEGRVEGEGEGEETKDNEANTSCHTNDSSSNANSRERLKVREAKSIDDVKKFRYVSPAGDNSSEKQKDYTAKRALPISLCANNREGAGNVAPIEVPYTNNDEEERKLTLFDVLRELAQQCTYDPRLENISVLEAAKLRGMTFP